MSVGFSKLFSPASQLVKKGFVRSLQQVRHGGGGPVKMNIVPTRWYDLQFREIMAFYTLIIAGPLIAISTYCNIFIGRAKLKPIPEGYEPSEEEYERHPITRWFMRNYYTNCQMLYEVKLHAVWEQWNYTHRMRLLKEIRRIMDEEGDYAAWSYSASDAKYARMARNEFEERKEYAGDFK